MKNNSAKLVSYLTLFLFTFSFHLSKAQCGLGPSSIAYGVPAGIIAPTTGTNFVTQGNYSPGTYFDFPMLNGGSYAISTCGGPIDSQITFYNPSNGLLAYNDDNGLLCSGSSASLDNQIPNFTGFAKIQVSQYNCQPGGSSSINVFIRQNNNLSFTSPSTSMCSGQIRNLTATPANVGSTPGGYGDPGTFSGVGVSGVFFTAPIVASATNYTITYTFGYVSQTQVITVNPNPTVSVNSGSICSGNAFTITPSGASTYTYSGGTSIVSPTTTTSYSITGTSSLGCISNNTAVATITVSSCTPAAALSFDGINDYVGVNNTSALNPSQFTIETWLKWGHSGTAVDFICGKNIEQMEIHTGGPSNNNIRFIPTQGVYLDGGINTITPGTWVHIACAYNPSIGLAKMYVNGANVPLTLSGPNSLTTAVISSTNNFIIGNRSNLSFPLLGEIDELRIWNTVRTQCEINTYMNCEIPTSAIGLIANYHFNQGLSLDPNPSVTNLIDASGSSLTGTLNAFALTGGTVSNWVTPGGVVSNFTTALPPITVGSTASNSVICQGNSTILNGTGANTYTWTGGVVNAIAFSPTTTLSYTVTGTSTLTGCTNTAVNTVTVNAKPTISVSSGAICSGNNFTIVPSGASTYTIQGGSAIVSPTSNSTYSVIGTSSVGCVSSNTAISSVTVNSLPVISAPTQTICVGATGTLTASGANTYTWSTGSNANFITASPVTTTTYTVNGTSSQGCSGNSITTTITVGSAPNIVVNSATVCAGNSATLNASGVTTYTWSTGANSNSIVVTPSVNTTYTISGNLTGCGVGANNTSTVNVNALPNVSAVSDASIICVGSSANLTASGASTYTWDTGANTTMITVSPTTTSTYSVTGTDANGCSNSAVIIQNVDACTGIANNLPNNNQFTIYPNPNNGRFTVELYNKSKVTIIDAFGKIIFINQFESGKNEINLIEQKNGIYFIKIETADTINTFKLLKE